MYFVQKIVYTQPTTKTFSRIYLGVCICIFLLCALRSAQRPTTLFRIPCPAVQPHIVQPFTAPSHSPWYGHNHIISYTSDFGFELSPPIPSRPAPCGPPRHRPLPSAPSCPLPRALQPWPRRTPSVSESLHGMADAVHSNWNGPRTRRAPSNIRTTPSPSKHLGPRPATDWRSARSKRTTIETSKYHRGYCPVLGFSSLFFLLPNGIKETNGHNGHYFSISN